MMGRYLAGVMNDPYLPTSLNTLGNILEGPFECDEEGSEGSQKKQENGDIYCL